MLIPRASDPSYSLPATHYFFPMHALRRSFATLGLLATAALARADYSFTQPFSETHPFNATGEVTLANVNGAVTIQTWDRAEVKIEGEKRAKTEEDLARIGLAIDATPATLSVKTDLPKRSGWFGGETIRAEVRITLTVPASVRLRKIDTVNGRITIDGVRGPVTAYSVNGGITAKGLGADTSIETVNGAIKADFVTVARDQKIYARTVNGSTTLRFPNDISLAVRARSVNGSISCDFPLRLEGGVGGHVLTGKIGDGAASLKTDTVNGSIHVASL
jgi:DUF4097 and DUF4098 domain-containing protein YvlB